MRLTLSEPTYLKVSISIFSDLVSEAKFKISTDSVELVAMDDANVAMVIFNLLSSCFVEYDVKEETEISINLNNLKQILRRASPKDMLTLEMEENRLKIELKSTNLRTFYLPIIELEEQKQKVPDLKFSASVRTSSKLLSESVIDADIAAESVVFIAEPKKFTLRAEGDLNQANIEIPEDDTTKISIDGDQVKAKYSIEYLKKMIAGSKLSDDVVIQFSKDYPLRLDYRIMDKMMLSFILAPRVENE